MHVRVNILTLLSNRNFLVENYKLTLHCARIDTTNEKRHFLETYGPKNCSISEIIKLHEIKIFFKTRLILLYILIKNFLKFCLIKFTYKLN